MEFYFLFPLGAGWIAVVLDELVPRFQELQEFQELLCVVMQVRG